MSDVSTLNAADACLSDSFHHSVTTFESLHFNSNTLPLHLNVSFDPPNLEQNQAT